MTRKYISLYFEDGLVNHRKKRDLTIAFTANDPLYEKCRNMSSSDIKKSLGISTYKELLERSQKEGRTLNNFVKFRLKKKLIL